MKNPIKRNIFFLGLFSFWMVSSLAASQIHWFCDLRSWNVHSDGYPLKEDFVFELGVFRDGFVPTKENRSQWSDHWVAAQRTTYHAPHRWFNAVHTVRINSAPFTSNTPGYIWGFQGDGHEGEWILLGRSNWRWPAANEGNLFPLKWRASDATVVLAGQIGDGASFDLKTEIVRDALPPVTTYAQWAERQFPGGQGSHPLSDGLVEGVPNLLAFAYGLDRGQGRSVPGLRGELVREQGRRHLQVRIPRRADHVGADLRIEVSTDLQNWVPAEPLLEDIERTPSEWVVRFADEIRSETPRRFVRVRAVLEE